MASQATAKEMSQDDYDRRMRKFTFEMSVAERLKTPIKGLCEEGKVPFSLLCSNPFKERVFISHAQKCAQCYNAFLKYLKEVTG